MMLQLDHERNLKLDAFERVEDLQRQVSVKPFFLTCKLFLLVFRSFLVLAHLHRERFIIFETLLVQRSTPHCPLFLLTGIRRDSLFILCFDWFFNFRYLDL